MEDKRTNPVLRRFIDCPVCHQRPKNLDSNAKLIYCTNPDCVIFDIDIPRNNWIGTLEKGSSKMTVTEETRDRFMNPIPG